MKRSSILPGLLALMSLTAAAQNHPKTGIVTTTSKEPRKDINSFVNRLMSQMTLDEKIGQLNLLTPGDIVTGSVASSNVAAKIKAGNVGGLFGINGGVEKIKQIQELAVTGSRLKIPLLIGLDVIHGYKTVFPIPLGLSCSWDLPMIERSARIAATEATAEGVNWVYSPMVDIARDPRWGRVAEGSGEDPYLGGEIAKAMIKGYQGNSLAAANTAMACVKHFALYGAVEAGRDYNTVDMSRVKMFEYYLPPYKAALDAGAGSVMTSFNEVDGIPATGNKWLLTDLLRKQWGFKGLVVTDYTAINEMIAHGMGDLQAVSALSLNAGVDMDMVGEGFIQTIKKSLQEGKTTQQQIDDACRRVLEAKYKLGLFEDPYRYCDASRSKEVLSAAHKKAAREFGARSIVLLKNNNQALPLKKSGTIALIGPLANDKVNMLGTWAVSGDRQLAIPVLDGVQRAVGSNAKVLYAKGANISDDTAFVKIVNSFTPYGKTIADEAKSPGQLLSEAVETASNADVVVAVVGETAEMTGEASSRTDISLPASQQKLLQALSKTGKPLVVVVMAGRPLTLGMENEIADALVDVWFQGQEAGNSIADVLFGDYNPSGKLTMTFPQHVGQNPIYYNHKNTGRPQPVGEPAQKFHSNYLDVSNEPLFPFGYGLSYTKFTYSPLQLSKNNITPSERLQVKVKVSNTGKYDGEETVQLYIHDVYASVAQPVKKLKAFQKIMLKAGETKEVTFQLTTEDLKFYNADLQYIYEPGEFKVMVGSNSRDVQEATFTLVKNQK
ncbi:MAG TPA: beta-glucosidase BglX [Chitinophaga sp.]|uniref:beta-glucosidase BglX n=1 Tax=Chitinophaga sp. TaxID=1869181 RepID=UPI002C1AE8E6|nr:beta-glucosidase BglX [Chitinophaga sp.]HVI44920.1 beta-glucosidase BglX [Chitinophaga sp.]